MPRPFRNPTQTRQLDREALRRQAKLLLTPDHIYDSAEWDEVLDRSNTDARQTIIGKNLIAARRNGGTTPRQLSDQERLALDLFILGEGPRPRFARFASPDGHYGQHWLRPDDPDAPKPGPAWPTPDPNEPDRYVQPKGDFAIPSDRGAS